jgi:RHS repeat-associated protein
MTTHHSGNIDSPFTYTGREFSSATGIFHYRARSYMPDLGRFTSRDPYPYSLSSSNTIQRYNYCSNSPTNFVDPFGLDYKIYSVQGGGGGEDWPSHPPPKLDATAEERLNWLYDSLAWAMCADERDSYDKSYYILGDCFGCSPYDYISPAGDEDGDGIPNWKDPDWWGNQDSPSTGDSVYTSLNNINLSSYTRYKGM